MDIDLLVRFLAGEASQEQQEQVMQWKSASAENTRLYEEFLKVWSAMDKTSKHRHIDMDAEWRLHVRNYNPAVLRPSRVVSIRTVFAIAASVLVILGFSFAGWLYMSQKTFKTDLAETNQIVLPDGSKVTLNAGSRLYYKRNFSKESRTVSLEGEAYFEVTKNPQSPFVIHVDGAEVKVLGTSFNVKAYKDMEKIEVTVSEGKVSLYGKGEEGKKVIVGKGEKAVYLKQLKVVQMQPNDDRNFMAWKTRVISFENDSLAAIVQTLNSVYHKDVILENPNLHHCTVTASFEDKDLSTVLKVLGETLDIVITEKDGKIYISGKGC